MTTPTFGQKLQGALNDLKRVLDDAEKDGWEVSLSIDDNKLKVSARRLQAVTGDIGIKAAGNT